MGSIRYTLQQDYNEANSADAYYAADDVTIYDPNQDVYLRDEYFTRSLYIVVGDRVKYLTRTDAQENNLTSENCALFVDFSDNTMVANLLGTDYGDILRTGLGNDTLMGFAGNDTLDGRNGADIMNGGLGNDRYFVDNANDTVVEFSGADYVLAAVTYRLKAGIEVERLSTTKTSSTTAMNLTGNEFAQRIDGNDGGNKLAGLDGNDTLFGHDGNDTLYGGAGKDALVGGLGNDLFVFDTALGTGNIDTITDFANVIGNNDTIRLDDAIFTKLTATGALNTALFAANAMGKATDGNDYIVYNTSTGALFYDADGNGASSAVQFATLAGAPAITAADVFVV